VKYKKVFILINSEQKGYFVSLADQLEKFYGFSVTIVARDKYVKQAVDRLLLNRKKDQDIVLSDIKIPDISKNELIKTAVKIEEKYNIRLSMLTSEDRALGQGYLFNVEKIPHVIRSMWSYERKVEEIIKRINLYESLLNEECLVISQRSNKIISMIARNHGAVTLSPVITRYGAKFFWSDNDYLTSTSLIKKVLHNLNVENLRNIGKYELIKVEESTPVDKHFNYFYALKRGFKVFINDSKNWIRGMQRKNSYQYLGWLPTVFRSVRNYRYIKTISKKPEDLSGFRIVFYPLHLEPEASTLFYSPEFSNTMDVIAYVSKSLPADTLLVVKEHMHSYGVRSRWYYSNINKIGNVVWADPEIITWDWIKVASIVTTITGTVGVEAVHLLKPVVSYGQHQIINYLPTVKFVSNYNETKSAIDYFLSCRISSSKFQHSSDALLKAQLDVSFDLAEYKKTYKTVNYEGDMAKKSLENLFLEYPELLKAN